MCLGEYCLEVHTDNAQKIDIKKEKEEMKAASVHQKTLKEKYAKIGGM